jgi:hypothetical protein
MWYSDPMLESHSVPSHADLDTEEVREGLLDCLQARSDVLHSMRVGDTRDLESDPVRSGVLGLELLEVDFNLVGQHENVISSCVVAVKMCGGDLLDRPDSRGFVVASDSSCGVSNVHMRHDRLSKSESFGCRVVGGYM